MRFLLGLLFLLSTSAVIAQEHQSPSVQQPGTTRIITTNGAASVHIPVDRVVVRFEIATWNADLRVADRENNTTISKIMSVAKKFKIDESNIIAGEINIRPTDKSNSGSFSSGNPSGYRVAKEITYELSNVAILPEFITEVMEAGADKVLSVKFDNSNLRKYKDEARLLAIRAAKEKAMSAAAEVNAKLGKTLVLKEIGSTILSNLSRAYPTTLLSGGSTFNVASAEDADFVAPPPAVTVNVSVTFEMVDRAP